MSRSFHQTICLWSLSFSPKLLSHVTCTPCLNTMIIIITSFIFYKVINALTGRRSPEPFNRYVSRLRSQYSAVDVLLPPTQSSSQARRVPLDTLFVKLAVLPKPDFDEHLGEQDFGSVDEAVKLQSALAGIGQPDGAVTLKDLFRDERESATTASRFRLSATSGAGGGKTTLFLKHAAQEWARGNLWKQFQLLAAMPLRLQSVHKAEHLADLLQLSKMGIIDPAEQTAIINFIKDNPAQMCFIMDGLDEVKVEECSEYIQGVLQGEMEKDVNIIITSRHSKNMFALQRKHPFDNQYEILGFSPEEIASFVRKRMDAADADCFLEAMSATEHIKSLMCTPFLLSHSCQVFLDTGELHSSVSSLYSAMILLQVRSVCSSTGRSCNNWTALRDETRESILEVGSFALRMLVENRTVFSQNEVEGFSLSAGARELKLLVPCASSPFKDLDQSQFSHLSLQEAIAAKYAAAACRTPDDIVELVHALRPLTGALATFWVLLAAELTPTCLDSLVHAILVVSTPKPTEDDYITASESTLIKLADELTQFLCLDDVDALGVRLLASLGQGVLAVKAQPDRGTDHYLLRLLLYWRRNVPVWRHRASNQRLRQAVDEVNPLAASEFFGPPSTPQPPDCEPDFSIRTPGDRRRLLLACRCASESLTATARNDATRPAVDASSSVPSLCHALTKTGLDLHHIRLSLADCQVLHHILTSFSGSICGIQFSDGRLTDSSLAVMLPGLHQCTGLTELSFQRNSLTAEHVDELSDVIHRNAATLRRLYTGLNAVGSADVSSLHRYTPLCAGLQEVSLGRFQCESHGVDVDTVELILSSCTQLTRVYFSGCQLGDDGLAELQASLQSLKLTHIGLLKTGLSEVSAPVLIDLILANSERLTTFNLSDNPVGDGAFQDVCAALQHCAILEGMYANRLGITHHSISSLSNLVRSCSHLTCLYLAGNDLSSADDDADGEFATAVLESESLESLRMPSDEYQLISATLHRQLSALDKPELKVKFSEY